MIWSLHVGIALVLFMLLIVNAVSAGECILGKEFYMECLEGTKQAEDCPPPVRALSCLGQFHPRYERWGIAAERRSFEWIQQLEYRERLIIVAEAYLDDPSTQRVAALVLAFQGVGKSGEHDIFELVVNQQWIDWFALAALGDSRTIALADGEYRRIHAQSTINDKSRRQLMTILDCLFHIRASQSRRLLRQLANYETDEQLLAYMKATTGVTPSN